MKTLILSLLVLGGISQAALQNFHSIDREQKVFRGAQPVGKAKELKALKFTDVLIIKQQTRGEVDKELAELKAVGIRSHVIPMKWADVEPHEVCNQMIEAVETLKKLKREKKKIYLHCTAGEDRTGAVAALYRMVEQGARRDDVYANEMCKKGYADGNPNKPGLVVQKIRKSITPAFFALANSIDSGSGLHPGVCERLRTEGALTRKSYPTCSSVMNR